MDHSLDSNRNEDFHFEYLNQFKDSLKSVPMTTENIIKAIKEFKIHRLMSVDLKINMLTSFKKLNITFDVQSETRLNLPIELPLSSSVVSPLAIIRDFLSKLLF